LVEGVESKVSDPIVGIRQLGHLPGCVVLVQKRRASRRVAIERVRDRRQLDLRQLSCGVKAHVLAVPELIDLGGDAAQDIEFPVGRITIR
jgi:hypothetical protein